MRLYDRLVGLALQTPDPALRATLNSCAADAMAQDRQLLWMADIAHSISESVKILSAENTKLRKQAMADERLAEELERGADGRVVVVDFSAPARDAPGGPAPRGAA